MVLSTHASREHYKKFQGFEPESPGQNLALTVLYVPYSLDSHQPPEVNYSPLFQKIIIFLQTEVSDFRVNCSLQVAGGAVPRKGSGGSIGGWRGRRTRLENTFKYVNDLNCRPRQKPDLDSLTCSIFSHNLKAEARGRAL